MEKTKKPTVRVHTRCICWCFRKLATPTAMEVNTSGMTIILSMSTNSVPISPAR